MPKIGTDIIEISRIEKNIENSRFMKRIYSEEELASLGDAPKAESLAVRFAAKEAVIKALGEGVPFHDISVIRGEYGCPFLRLHGKAEACAVKQGLRRWEVSLSHCKEYALAFVMGFEEVDKNEID